MNNKKYCPFGKDEDGDWGAFCFEKGCAIYDEGRECCGLIQVVSKSRHTAELETVALEATKAHDLSRKWARRWKMAAKRYDAFCQDALAAHIKMKKRELYWNKRTPKCPNCDDAIGVHLSFDKDCWECDRCGRRFELKRRCGE